MSGDHMRDQYAGDISDVLKFAFLRALTGANRTLGIAWYYAPGNDGSADGRHLEWHNEAAWRSLDEQLCAGLTALPERSIAVAIITFPKRVKHDIQLQQLHQRLADETDAKNIMTLRTSVSVRVGGSYVPRARWFTIVDPDAELTARAQAFAAALASVPRVRARLYYTT